MSAANCCMTQKSSSSDNLAPRPIQLRTPSELLPVASQCYETGPHRISSSSTVSPLSNQEDIAELQAIFEEDKSSAKDGIRLPKAKKSSRSLVSVKNRLKKHLSRELKIPRHRSRSSVGTSEEEIERRAELRRIRQKRIQEELSSEFGYDSDAKSLQTIAVVDSAGEDGGNLRVAERGPQVPATRSPTRWTPALSPPPLISPYLKERALQLAARLSELSPPRYPVSLQPTSPRSDYISGDLSKLVNTPGTLHSQRRRHSSPEAPVAAQGEKAIPPQVPFAPNLEPQRLPSFQSKSSWRLSFASDNRGAHLRSLSQDETSTTQTEDSKIPHSINQWLRNQGLRSTSPAFTSSEDTSSRELSVSHSQDCFTDHANKKEVPFEGAHLQDMIASQPLATCTQDASLWQQLHTANDGPSRHNPSHTAITTGPSRTVQEFHANKAYRPCTTDHCLSFMVSHNELLQDRDATIRSYLIAPTNANTLNPLLTSPVTITPYAEHGDCAASCTHTWAGNEVAETLNTCSKNTDISYNLALSNLENLLRRCGSRKKSLVGQKSPGPCSSGPDEAFKEDDFATSQTESLEKKVRYFDNWRKKLNGVAKRAKGKSRSVIKKSISDRRYRTSWSKYTTHDRKERGRRGSLVPSLPVEYPELELLPGDMMTAAQIEAYVHDELEDEEMERQREELKAIFSAEVARRESSLAVMRQSAQNDVADRLNEEQIAPGPIELAYLTPTKCIAERTKARKSRKKAEYEAMKARSLMIARESRGKVDTGIPTQPQLDAHTNTKMIEESDTLSIEATIPRGGTNPTTTNALYDCQGQPGVGKKSTQAADMEVPKTDLGSSRFYDDCIMTPASDEVDYKEVTKYEDISPKSLEKGPFETWSPGNWEKYKDSTEAKVAFSRPLSFGHLRKSTDDFHVELEKMETLERKKVLRVAQEAWGNAS